MAVKDIETRVVTYMDANMKAARAVAYVVATLCAIFCVLSLITMTGTTLAGALVYGAAAISLIWLLAKTRGIAVSTPTTTL